MASAIYLENTKTGKRYGIVASDEVPAKEYLALPQYLGMWRDWLRRAVYFENHPGELAADWPTIVASVPTIVYVVDDDSLWCGEWHLYELH